MPRYVYFCEDCQDNFIVFHGINENQIECTMCNSEAIKKMLTKPIHFTKKKNESTGKLTKKYIEDNKEILKDLKKESQKNYDGT
jgi:putative FmdB family regulatory protein